MLNLIFIKVQQTCAEPSADHGEGRGIGTQRDHRADPGPARCLPSTTQRSYGFLRTGDRRGLDAQNSTRRAATFGRSWDERGRAAAGVVAVRGRSAS